MAITTTDSIAAWKPVRCSRCGHPAELAVFTPDGKPVHERGQCPPHDAPASEGADVAFDPMAPGISGADVRAIERLQAKGVNFRAIAFRKPPAPVHEAHGDFVSARQMRPVAELVAEGAARLGTIAFPAPVGQEEVARTPHAQAPLGKKPKVEN